MNLKRKFGIAAMAVVALFIIVAVYIYAIGIDIGPVDVSDLAPPVEESVAPEDNALTYFAKARDVLADSSIDSDIGSYLNDNRTNMALIAAVLSDNEEALQLLYQGVQCQRCIFPVWKAAEDESFNVSGMGDVGRLLLGKIWYEQAQGNIDIAIHDIHALLRYGKLMRQTPSTLISQLLGNAIVSKGLGQIRDFARDPQLSEDHLKQLLEYTNDIPSYDMSALLTQYGPYYAMALKKMKAEGLVPMVYSDSSMSSFEIFMLNAVVRHNLLVNATHRDLAQRHRALMSDFPKFFADINFGTDLLFWRPQPWWKMLLSKNAFGKSITLGLASEIRFGFEQCCRADSDIAATKIIIACHLFQREAGRKPNTLDELVPTYLTSVPLDPFDGKPFRYNPDTGVIYSVGKTLKSLGDTALVSKDASPWLGGDNIAFSIWE